MLSGIRWVDGPDTDQIERNGYVVTQHFVVLLSQFTLPPPMLRTTLRTALNASRRPAFRPTIARRCMATSEDKMRSRATTGVCIHYGWK